MAAIYYCMFESLSTIQRLEVLEKKQLPDQKGIYGFRMSKSPNFIRTKDRHRITCVLAS